jgi:hypothetical protein
MEGASLLLVPLPKYGEEKTTSNNQIDNIGAVNLASDYIHPYKGAGRLPCAVPRADLLAR